MPTSGLLVRPKLWAKDDLNICEAIIANRCKVVLIKNSSQTHFHPCLGCKGLLDKANKLAFWRLGGKALSIVITRLKIKTRKSLKPLQIRFPQTLTLTKQRVQDTKEKKKCKVEKSPFDFLFLCYH